MAMPDMWKMHTCSLAAYLLHKVLKTLFMFTLMCALCQYHYSSDKPLMNNSTLSHIESLVSEHGTDCWWTLSTEELLSPEYRDNGRTYVKGRDTLDVWFDSGSSWAGVLKSNNLAYPADMYLEGSDQHRGWFQSSLLTRYVCLTLRYIPTYAVGGEYSLSSSLTSNLIYCFLFSLVSYSRICTVLQRTG